MSHTQLHTAHLIGISTGIPDLETFRITGPLIGEDITALSRHVKGIF